MDHKTHKNHDHTHGADCGHLKIKHQDHIDYLHEGHLHHVQENQIEEHSLEISGIHPERCQPVSGSHNGHVHGADCGHEQVPHGDHFDYLVDGILHHYHGDHCDDHGSVEIL